MQDNPICPDKFKGDLNSYYRMVAIINAACSVCGVDAQLLLSRGKPKRVTTAREIIVYIAKAELAYSYPDIAEWFGRPRTSHSTVHDMRNRIVIRPGYLDLPAWEGAKETKGQLLQKAEQMLGLAQEAKA